MLVVYQNIIYLHEKDDVVSSLTSLTKCLNPKVLDLHENKLASLPEDIGKLASLQVKPYQVKSE